MRFPQTAALIQAEGEAILDAILAHEDFQALLQRKMESSFMASVQDLKSALDSAKSSFDSLVGQVGQSQGGIDPSELDPILLEIKDLQTKIDDVKSSLPSKTETGATGVFGTSGAISDVGRAPGVIGDVGGPATSGVTAGTAPNPLS